MAKRKLRVPTNKQVLRALKAQSNKSKHDHRVRAAIALAGVPMPVAEHRFDKVRKWRVDFAWIDRKLAIEINGGGGRGRHNTVMGATKDAEKTNAAILQGWRVLAFTVISIKDVELVASTIRAAYFSEQAA